MKTPSHDLPVQDGPDPETNRRMAARKVVRLKTIVADNLGIARGQVTNICPKGCELSLGRSLRRTQYIWLKVYLDDGSAIQISWGKVRWIEQERAGVEFLSVPQQHALELSRLCAEPIE